MNEKLILPRFNLPQDSTRVAMRTLWAAGGLVVIATLILGLAMWRHRTLEIATAEEAMAKAAAARRAAMMPPAPPAVPAVADKGGAAAGAGVHSPTTLAAMAPTDMPHEAAAAPSLAPRPHHAGKLSSKARMRALLDQKGAQKRGTTDSSAADKGGGEKIAGKKSRSNDDVIDRLLNGYK